MQLEMAFKNVEANDRIKEFIDEKSERLTKFFDGNIVVQWTISMEHNEHLAKLHVLGNSMEFHSEATDHNIMTSVEDAVHKMETQLKKKKEQLRSHDRKLEERTK